MSVSESSAGSRRFRLAVCVAALAAGVVAPVLQAQQKQPVDRADQLPVHSYAIPKAPSALLGDDAALTALADSLRVDLEADLAAYDVRNAAALRSYYRSLGTIAMLRHRLDEALLYESRAQPLEEKPAARMLSGMTLRPLIAAEKAPAGGAAQAFSAAYAAELARLPYESVQAELKTNRARLEIFSAAFLEGQAVAELDPAAKAGRISKDLAIQVVNIGFALRYVVPHRDEMIRQLSALFDAHRVDKKDIWAARDVSLENRQGLTPVVIAICDGGVDASLFSGRVWTNPKEVPANGKDDDGNGFVDDVHGIAWTWDGKDKVGDLRPLELSPSEAARAKQNLKGFLDMQAALDSTEASELKRRLASMSRDDVKPLLEGVQSYAVHAHGTHVAGIATRGNPAARVLVVRVDFPYRMVAPAPTADWAAGFARAMERSVAYYRKAGVRVVNMSWGISSRNLEHDLEMNGVGENQEVRHRLAMQYFDTVKKAFGAAIAAASDILFVSAAGNSNESNQFNEDIPPAYDFPNTITVGAVDQGGDEAAFTSFGKVDLYANGYEVESVLPGGDKMRWSGTSMSSPQVVNLAAKLFAAYPRLSAAEVKKLIVGGSDPRDVSGGRSIRLMNETRSFDLAGAVPWGKGS